MFFRKTRSKFLTPRNGNIEIGNEVDLEPRNISTRVQRWRFLALYVEVTVDNCGRDRAYYWGMIQNAESESFLTAHSNISLTIEEGNFKF